MNSFCSSSNDLANWRLAILAALLLLLILSVDSACKAEKLPPLIRSVVERIQGENITAHAKTLRNPEQHRTSV